MKKRLVVFLVSLLVLCFMFSSVSALIIKVKTVPFYEVEVSVADGNVDGYSLIKRFDEPADYYGDAEFTLETTKPILDIYFFIKINGETVVKDKESYMGYEADEGDIYVERN